MNLLPIVSINESEFEALIESNVAYSLIELSHKYSGWALLMREQIGKMDIPAIQQIAYYKINVDTAPHLVDFFRITKLPKYLLYQKQQLLCTFEGLMPNGEIEKVIKNSLLKSKKHTSGKEP